ncbi:MAG: hypothetical protein WAT37_09550 [Saprospiraceae bacterium]|jgi:hypothetical protein|nr:hypothetical protein [Saprospiraceae bacterium]MBP6237724.1 hypothetical protein [Saprospiraceae bacterium]
MKWTYSLKNKLTAAILLFGLIVVVCSNNLFERNNAEKINATITTIFDDRFMVESYIFQYSALIYQIKEILNHPNYTAVEKIELNKGPLKGILLLNDAYKKTKFTKEEVIYFDQFTDLCKKMSNHINVGQTVDGTKFSNEALNILANLSAIQISEAKIQLTQANKLFHFGSISSQFELAILVIFGLIIQALIFASKSINLNKSSAPFNLN